MSSRFLITYQGATDVRKEIFAWQMVTTTSAVVEWSSVMAGSGGQCVMMAGAITRLKSRADS